MSLFLAIAFWLLADAPPARQTIPISTKSEEARREYLAGRTLVENLRNTEAIPHFREALRLDPGFALAHLALSNVSPTATEFQSERAAAVKSMSQATEGEQLLIQAAEAGAAAKPLEARALFTRLVTLYPNDARAQMLLALNEFGAQEFSKAIEGLSRAIAIEPGFAAPYNQRGYARRAVHDFKGAEEDFKSYIRLLPDDPNPYDSYAELLLATGRYDESIGAYKRALGVRSSFIASRLGIMTNLVYLGRTREALAAMDDYRKAARNQAERVNGFYQTAAIYVSLDDPKKAAAELEKSLQSNESIRDYAAAAFDAATLARTHLEYGALAEAKKWERRSEELSAAAKQPRAVAEATELGNRYNRIRLLLADHKLAAARGEIAKYRADVAARRFTQGIRRASELEGMLALAEDRWDDAIAALKKANLQDPYNLYRLALAYEGARQTEEAKSYYKQTVALNQLLNLNYEFVRNKAKARLMGLRALASLETGGVRAS